MEERAVNSTVTVTLGTKHFAEANEIVREACARTDEVELSLIHI